MALASEIQVRIHSAKLPFVREMLVALGILDEEEFVDSPLTGLVAQLVNEKRINLMEKRGQESVRPGLGDTGRLVFGKDGLKNVETFAFVNDLVLRGYKFVEVSYRLQTKYDKDNGRPCGEKFVIQAILSNDNSEESQEEVPLRNLLDALKDKAFRYGHVWENDQNHTVNLTGEYDPNVGKCNQLVINEKGEYSVVEFVKPRPARANA